MISGILSYLEELTRQDRIFAVFGLLILFLLIMVIVFAFYTVFLRLRNTRRAEQWARREASWEPLLLNYLSGDQSKESVLEEVPVDESLQFVDYLQRFAERLHGVEIEAIKQLAEPYLPTIVDRITEGDAPRRARAVRTIGTLGLHLYPEALLKALDDPSPLVAMIAARMLTDPDHPEYASAVLERLHRFTNWSQGYLVSLLTSVGVKIVPTLQATLVDDDKPTRVRSVAADALRALNDFEAGDLAAEILKTASDRELLAATLRLVASVGRPVHLEAVRPHALSDDFVIRAHALKALGHLGGQEEWPLLRQGLDHESNWVALHAAQGLKEAGGEQILFNLLETGHLRIDLARQVLASSHIT